MGSDLREEPYDHVGSAWRPFPGPAGGEGVCPRTAASLSWGNSLEFTEAEASGIRGAEYQRGENSTDTELQKSAEGSP